MYGKNALLKQDLTRPNELRVKEIFYTIQGEGPRSGQPAVFVRLGGCNLRCFFCDTDFETGIRVVSPLSIVHAVQGYHTNLVVITGGEPLLQDLTPLCAMLIENGFIVQIETAGTVWVPGLPDAVEIVCSPKTGSVHPEIALRCRHWKYIIRAAEVSETDGLPEYSTQIDDHVAPVYRAKQGIIYVQPMDEGAEDGAGETRLNLRAAVQSCMEFGYHLSLQVHKIAGVE